jgi:salicylate hydroxylase
MRIGVIGTGVAGSLLTEQLAAAPGIIVEAFDHRDPGAAAGTGLNLGPNAMRALRLHLPARHAAIRAASLPWRRWTVDLADGTRLLDIDLLDVAEEAGVRIAWAELYRLLRAPIADRTRQDLELVALEEDAMARLVPVLRDPTGGLLRPTGFDLLVAGDGRYSALRRLSVGPPIPTQHGLAMSRLLVLDAADCPFDDYGQWFNGNARMLGYRLPQGAAYVTGALLLPDVDSEIPDHFRSPDYQRAVLLPRDRPACPAVAWMVGQMTAQASRQHWARLQSAPMLRSAAGGRVLFLGDAAQAMVPTLGQGATQAIEDGVLAGLILGRGGGVAEVAAARDRRVAFVRDFSLAASDTMFPPCDPIAGTRAKAGPDFLAKLRRTYTDIYDRLG